MEHTKQGENGCKCLTISQCELKDCDCQSFCSLLMDEYISIIHSPKYYFTTVSPPHIYSTQKECIDQFKHELEKFISCTNYLICVIELSKKHVPHFHILYSINDIIKHSHIIFELAKTNNVEAIRQHEPKYKIHYLFKDIIKTFNNININPIITTDDIKMWKQQRKQSRLDQILHTRQINLDKLTKSIPNWMLQSPSKSI